MTNRNFLLGSLLVTALLVLGCTKTPTTIIEPSDVTEVSETEVILCGECGQAKGSDACCVEGAEACGDCGLVKGSPGCCTIEKGTDVTLCMKCGQISGSDACCVEGAEKCDKCGLDKGSPGCCAI